LIHVIESYRKLVYFSSINIPAIGEGSEKPKEEAAAKKTYNRIAFIFICQIHLLEFRWRNATPLGIVFCRWLNIELDEVAQLSGESDGKSFRDQEVLK